MRAADWVGRILAGKYRVDRVVGEGGMGVVFEVLHTDLDERFAVKVLHGAGDNADLVRRFLREGKASAKIRSDHIARVHDVGRLDEGTPYLVMELLVGADLESILENQGPIPPQVAVDYAIQACDALSEAHKVGIVHRDVKPSNLFLTHRRTGVPCIKVLDFGISKLTGDVEDVKKTGAQDIFGSPLYMSPEALLSTRDVDERADIWALGVVLYELLTGQLPFSGETAAAIHIAIMNNDVPVIRRGDVPPGLMEVLTRALAKNREERIPTAADFAEQLAPFASTVGLEALNTLRATNPPRPPSGHDFVVARGAGSSGPFIASQVPTVAAFETTQLAPARRWRLPALLAGIAVPIAAGLIAYSFVSKPASKTPAASANSAVDPGPALTFLATAPPITPSVETNTIASVVRKSHHARPPRAGKDAGVPSATPPTPPAPSSAGPAPLPDDRR